MGYIEQYTKQETEVIEPEFAIDAAEAFVADWLERNQNFETRDRKIRITIAFEPTSEQVRQAADDEYFDSEYS